MNGKPIDNLLASLDGVRKTGKGWSARCPAHDDRHASLSVAEGDDGRVLIHCHAGCTLADVLRELRLTEADLFSDAPQACQTRPQRTNATQATPSHPGPDRTPTTYATTDAAAEAIGRQARGRLVDIWRYETAQGDDAMCVLRFDLPDTGKTFRPIHPESGGWAQGDPRGALPLYRLPELMAADPGRPAVICEGEKATDAAAGIGLPATTSAHGAKAAARTDWAPLAGRDVILLPDADDAGAGYAEDVVRILTEELDPPARVRVVDLPGLAPHGDIADWLSPDGPVDGKTAEECRAAVLALAADTLPAGKCVPTFVSAGELMKAHRDLRPRVIEGLLRRGELMNVIAPPKTGKSWLALDLALAVVTGRPWLSAFTTTRGDVLMLDNELHRETIAHRLPKVSEARAIPRDKYAGALHVDTLRGRNLDLFSLRSYFRHVQRGRFSVVILDALYRFWPKGADENSNASISEAYNCLDMLAARLGCCFVLIHHASKGNQSGKAIVDVGAGAGAQARATDTHLILRPHTEPGAVVLDAAVRSWPPVDPFCLRWTFPVWQRADDLDPAELRRERGGRRHKGKAGEDPATRTYDTPGFVKAFIDSEPRGANDILSRAMDAGLAERRARKLLESATGRGLCFVSTDPADKRRKLYSTQRPGLLAEDEE